MYQSSLFPLRTAVGRAIPIGKKSSVKLLSQSPASRNLNIVYDWDVKPSIGDTEIDSRYAEFLPQLNVGGTTFVPGSGMDVLPLPPAPLPFAEEDDVISFFAMAKNGAASDVSRKLSVRFLIGLQERSTIGGICFGGFPYLPYSSYEIGNLGVNSSNFGLPREVRLVCSGATTADEEGTSSAFEFLDSETTTIKQDIISHSGFHFLPIDPTLTQYLTVQFSDYPRILRKVGVSPLGFNTAESRYGFIIPYFYVYEYQETTRYRPQISAGLLGVKRVVPGHPTGPFTLNNLTTEELVNSGASGLNNDHRNIVETSEDDLYYDFTAASMFGQQRRYIEQTKVNVDLKECFISTPVLPGGKIVIYIQQAEDYDRCVAGLKMLVPFVPKVGLSDASMQAVLESVYALFENLDPDDEIPPREELEVLVRAFLRIPEDIDFCEKIRIRVFEIDPPEGVSPASIPPDDKYSTLLAEVEIDELQEIALAFFVDGIRFTRPSNCKYFAIEMTNYDDVAGQFVVKALRVVQSAHVSVHPRPARTQQVKTLNFRIIGEELAEDYALLGNEGFNFSIERFVAGERKSVLFRANSLLDLLHTGAAKIFNNVRRRAVEFEKSEVYPAFEDDWFKYLIPGEFELDEGYSFTPNYEKRYLESDMEGWRRSETGEGVGSRNSWSKKPSSNKPYKSFSNQKVRTKNRLIYPISKKFNRLRTWFDAVAENAGFTRVWIPALDDIPDLWVDSDLWRGVSKSDLKIKGLLSISANPTAFTNVAHLDNTLIQIFERLAENKLFFTGGSNSSQTAGIGLISTTMGSNPYPLIQYQTTYGTQGLITLQAVDTGYSYSQYRNKNYDEGDNYTRVDGGEMKRVLTRKEVPGTDKQRIRGGEVMWQGELVDIITGAIPLNFTLPASASKMHFRTTDDSLRVRFGSGVGKSITVDFWFDITEEVVGDDY